MAEGSGAQVAVRGVDGDADIHFVRVVGRQSLGVLSGSGLGLALSVGGVDAWQSRALALFSFCTRRHASPSTWH